MLVVVLVIVLVSVLVVMLFILPPWYVPLEDIHLPHNMSAKSGLPGAILSPDSPF
jgi:hypothetical protein